MDNNKKAEEIFKKDKSFKNGERKTSQHVKHEKKHGNSNRHSYHQQTGGGGGGMLYNGNDNIYEVNNEDPRSFVTRERSFVRPQSTAATFNHSQMKEHQHQKRRSGMALSPKGKPALEIYRPPTLRSSTFIDTNEEAYNGKLLHNVYDVHGNMLNNNHHSSSNFNNNNNHINNNNHNNNNNNNSAAHIKHRNSVYYDKRKPGLNIHAKEFVSYQGSPSLHHSMSSSSVHMYQQGKRNLQHSKSGAEIKQEGMMISSSKVHFAETKDNDPDTKLGMTNRTLQSKASLESYGSSSIHNPIKRSKSLGSVDLRQAVSEEGLEPLSKMGPFSKEVQKLLSDAINDPNKLSARHLMDAVRHVIIRVIETSRYSEPGAQICIRIIQREKEETFLETLLNTCQEYYQERQRLLRNTQNSPYPGGIVSYPRWIAYMSFLNEMYTQLKRRHNQLMTQQMKNNETPPGIHLLTLLAQCCFVCLQESVINSLSETECLFFVLTAVGKDIELKLPQHMARVMCAARDAFLSTVHLPAVRKTLLQLIEMHAARWNLSAPAVMYYYPGCCPTK